VDEERHDEIMENGKSRGQSNMERQRRMQEMQDGLDMEQDIVEAMGGGGGGNS
jgi:hypothetical protein